MRVQGDYARGLIAQIYISDSLFQENWAPMGGGVYASYGMDLFAERTVFHDNVAEMGGSVDISGPSGNARFAECNFTGGFAYNGGGGEVGGERCVCVCVWNGISREMFFFSPVNITI